MAVSLSPLRIINEGPDFFMGKKEMAENKIVVGARDKLPFWYTAVWSVRDVSLVACTILIAYVTFYSTDVLGLSATLVGMLLMVSKVFDGFTDLAVGFLIDRTNTKLGRARPYELTFIFLWVFLVLLFSTPELGTVGKAVWVFVMYTLIQSVCVTILYGNGLAYLIRAVKKQENRVKLTAVAGIYVLLSSTIITVLVPQAIKTAGVDRHSWTMLVAVFAVPGTVLGLLRFIFIKEVMVEQKPVQLSMKEGISAMSKNKYIWIFAALYFCFHLANGVNGGAAVYYFKYAVGDIGVQSFVSMGMIVVPFLLAFAPKIMRKIGTAKTMRIGFGIMTAGIALRLSGGINMVTQVLGSTLFIVGYTPIAFMLNVYQFEYIDYGQWKTGKRVESTIACIVGFVAKIASALASAGVGFAMGLSGYNNTAVVQSGSAMAAISILYNIVPLGISVLAFAFSFKYDLEKKLPHIRSELATRENTQDSGGETE
jgi:Na+/melibiose symporter-like transporter